MSSELPPAERETHLSMTGDNHSEWIVFTDDPHWQRRLERLGIVPISKLLILPHPPCWQRRLERLGIVPVKVVGASRQYRLTADQVLIRKGKPQVSEVTRLARSARFKNSHTVQGFAT